MPRVVTLGPLALPTLMGDVKETVGEQLETVGAGVVPGERRPRSFALTIPVHGEPLDGASRFLVGNRLRRQVRALMENSAARLQGLYLAFTPDTELNGWLLVGGGDLAYDQGGIALADYKLELSDCYKVASLRTHRPARRLSATDRRLATTPRDTLGTVYSTDFAAQTATTRLYLPVGTVDTQQGSTRRPVNPTVLTTADGSLGYLDGLADGEVIDFEQGESDMPRADVKVWDRQGAGIVETGWERVYGPDQPLSTTDVPVVENALVRVLWDTANKRWDVQDRSGGVWVTEATVVPPVTLLNTRPVIVEWTPERAVLVVNATIGTPTTSRVQVFVTLQRGWTGPRFECYVQGTAGAGTALLSVYAKTAGDATFEKSTGGAVAITTGGGLGTFVGLGAWGTLLGPGTDLAVWTAVVQEAVTLTGATLASREGVTFSTTTGYVAVWLGIGPRATGPADATTHGARGLIEGENIPELIVRT